MRGRDIHGQIVKAMSAHKGEDLTTQQVAALLPELDLKQVQSGLSRISRGGNPYGITKPRRGVYRMPLRRPSAVVAALSETRRPTSAIPARSSEWDSIRELGSGDVLLERRDGSLWRATKII